MLQHKPFFFLLAYGESTLSCCCSQRPEKKNVVSTQDEGQIRTTLLKFIFLMLGNSDILQQKQAVGFRVPGLNLKYRLKI